MVESEAIGLSHDLTKLRRKVSWIFQTALFLAQRQKHRLGLQGSPVH